MVAWPARDELAAQARAFPLRPDLTDYVRGPGRAATAIDAYLARRGDPIVTEVDLYPRYVLFTVLTSPVRPPMTASRCAAGTSPAAGRRRSSPIRPRSSRSRTSPGAVLPGLYEQLEAEMGFSDGQLRSSRRQVEVQRSNREGGAVGISVLLYDAYRSGTLEADQEGTPLEIR